MHLYSSEIIYINFGCNFTQCRKFEIRKYGRKQRSVMELFSVCAACESERVPESSVGDADEVMLFLLPSHPHSEYDECQDSGLDAPSILII